MIGWALVGDGGARRLSDDERTTVSLPASALCGSVSVRALARAGDAEAALAGRTGVAVLRMASTGRAAGAAEATGARHSRGHRRRGGWLERMRSSSRELTK